MNAESELQLNVTVVLPGGGLLVWQCDLLAKLRDSTSIALSTIIVADADRAQHPRNWFFDRWKAFDRRTFRKILPGGICSEDMAEEGAAREFNRIAADRNTVGEVMAESPPDIVVWLIADRPPERVSRLAGIGVWTLPNATRQSAGYAELVERIPVTLCSLVALADNPSDDKVLLTAYARTDLLSLSRSLLAVRAKDQRLLLTMLERVGGAVLRPVPGAGTTNLVTIRRAPGAVGLLWGLTRLYSRYGLSLITRRIYFNHWQIAYRRGGDRLDRQGLIRFAPDHKGFWADPFIVHWKNQTALFFEELPEGETTGNIVVSLFEEDGAPGAPRTVIKRDYHLSYPFIFEFDGELYMTPESAAANRVESYRCVQFPDVWEPHQVLLDGIKAYDPTLIEYDGRWWMFVSVEAGGNSSADELHVFYASTPFGNWTPHPLNPVNNDVRSARPAGAMYIEDGELYRPAQDCSVRYGYALSIQKILRLTDSDYAEEQVAHILPDWAPDSWGTHTVNQAAGITVYDTYTRRRK